jgi:peroxidase
MDVHGCRLPLALFGALAFTVPCLAAATDAGAQSLGFEARTLDGARNNPARPSLGSTGTPYSRLAPAAYADGTGAIEGGPNARFVSNRIFNDLGQNVFSSRGVTQWAWTWGQFMDHTIGLAKEGTEKAPLATDASDPLERFRNDLGAMSFTRDAAAPGTSGPREQVNTVSSFIDGFSVYGGTPQREEWLREGPVDGDLADNGPHLLLTGDGYLPRATARGDAASAPEMVTDGMLQMDPSNRAVAGDQRANENLALTGVQTLFAREHNRIVDALPSTLSSEKRFQIARRVVGAEQQWITYHEFLPSLGVRLPRYRGYRPGVDPSIGNEFATVGYRAHSMIHGEFEIEGRWSPDDLTSFERQGIEAEPGDDGETELVVPLGVAFFNPDLVPRVGLGPVMTALGAEPQYANDEQIDDSLRSVLFQVPGPNAPDPTACFSDPSASGCYQGMQDLGALDVLRGRDHGIPAYNALRRALGLRPRPSFAAVTGEPAGPAANPADPRSIDYVDLRDGQGRSVTPGTDAAENSVVLARRRTTLAARLEAVYGSVDKLDAFVGMVSEPHVPGTEFGELQLAMWARQFAALRDGDRFFYGNDPALDTIRRRYGITYKRSLAQLILLDTDARPPDINANVFLGTGTASAPAPERSKPQATKPAKRPARGRGRGGRGGGRRDDGRGRNGRGGRERRPPRRP